MEFNRAVFLIFILFFVSCGNQRSKVNDIPESKDRYIEIKLPIEINTNQEYEKKSLILEKIADVEYIPLETNNKILLSNFLKGLSISDSLIVTINQEHSVFIFGRDGRLITQFNHVGRGPEEYQSISKIAVDFNAKEIYVCDYALRYKILVYSIAGNFKRSFNVPVSLRVNDFVDYDESHLLAYITVLNQIKKQEGPFRPYYLVSKQNGTLKQLDIEVPEIKDGKIYKSRSITENLSRASIRGFNTSPIIKNGRNFFISDFACDTLYSFNNKTTLPFIVNKPSLQNLKLPLFVGISLKTTRYTFLSIVDTKEETMEVNRRFLGIDHYTGEIFQPEFHDRAFEPILENYFRNLLPEYSAMSISALKLVDAYEKGELTGELKKIASGMQEGDNPVLVLVKFKK